MKTFVGLTLILDPTFSKIQKGFETYERNTGSPHPLAAGLSKKAKRATGKDALTDDDAELWYGTISVGTPAKTYTG